jgi:hypothetical protein
MPVQHRHPSMDFDRLQGFPRTTAARITAAFSGFSPFSAITTST